MKRILLVISVLLLAALLRFNQLGQNPPSLYWDEVALGYNAFSIGETGKDEEGSFLPVQYIRSFGDFKPPVYVYAAVPLIKLFGLNEWTTRFPSAFFGTLSVLLTYTIVKILMQRVRRKDQSDNWLSNNSIEATAIISALLLAISPWHVQISRVAFEANLALFLVLLGVYLAFKAFDSTKWKTVFFVTSGLCFAITLYTFNSNRVFTPLLVALLGVLYYKELLNKELRNRRPAVIAMIAAVIITFPVAQHMLSPQGQLRYKEVNIFTNSEIIELSNQRIAHADNSIVARIVNNRRVLYAQEWLDGYFRHFSGKFLFISGDNNPRFSLQDVGGLYLIELPFLLIGLYIMASRINKEYAFILGWMLLAPIPAAFAREVPHALRSLNILPTFQIAIAIGCIYAFHYIKASSIRFKKVVLATTFTVSALLLGSQLYYFQHNYYVHYPQYAESEWQYGYKQMVNKVTELEAEYDRIVITDGLARPYINVLFYKQYPPAQFQKERKAETDATGFGFINVYEFSKYQFHGLSWKREIAGQKSNEKVLVVGVPGEIPEGKFTKATIKNLKNEVVFIINELPKGQDALLELK